MALAQLYLWFFPLENIFASPIPQVDKCDANSKRENIGCLSNMVYQHVQNSSTLVHRLIMSFFSYATVCVYLIKMQIEICEYDTLIYERFNKK